MKRRLLLILIILTVLTVVTAIPVNAEVGLKEYLNTGGDGNSTSIYAGNYYAMQFTSNSTAHSITKIKLSLKRVGTPGDINIYLRAASAGAPTTSDNLVSLTYDGDILSTDYDLCELALTIPYIISALTQYAIIVGAPSGDASNYVLWEVDSGGALANAVASKSTDKGVTWVSETPKDCLFEIYGDDVLAIYSAKVFQGYLEDDDLLICAEVLNNYPPYAPNTLGVNYDVRQYFNIQLLSTNGSVVIASVPLTSWDRAPESVYLNSALAGTLTPNGAYIVRIIGTYSGAPSVTYALQSTDWQGDDLTKLDAWIRITTYNLEDYYGETLSQWNTDIGGSILNDIGGGIFTTAIPGISSVRTDLFAYAKTRPQLDIGTDTNTYDSSKSYTVLLGSEIAGDLNTGGTIFGISGKDFGGLVIAIGIALVIVCGAFMGQVGAIPILIAGGIPLLFIGNGTGLIGIQWTIVLAVLMFLMFVRQMWWKTT